MHTCAFCGCACYCHGDIDDCEVEQECYSREMCEGCGCPQDQDFGGDNSVAEPLK